MAKNYFWLCIKYSSLFGGPQQDSHARHCDCNVEHANGADKEKGITAIHLSLLVESGTKTTSSVTG